MPESYGSAILLTVPDHSCGAYLHPVVPKLPKGLKAPVVIVQHMPAGFTASLAERLDTLSEVHVKEAAEGDVLEPGVVYIAMGGKHLNVVTNGNLCIQVLKVLVCFIKENFQILANIHFILPPRSL